MVKSWYTDSNTTERIVQDENLPFSALLGRMKYITRWSLMRSGRAESLSEHTADTALLAHTLCLIGQKCLCGGADLRPEMVATAALYHDAPEILTGDMPTPVKYKTKPCAAPTRRWSRKVPA